jgi:Uncharacterized protein SCO1/SenC/PrrC, involved in biogenesis of respiratory and photosynthetic systems
MVKNNCGQIRKTRNSFIMLGISMLVLAYFLLIPGAEQLRDLQAQVKPTVSLYSNPKPLGEKFPLINDEGQIISLAEAVKNKWAILYFGYTSCPDVCPTDLATLNQTLKSMQYADKLQIVFISVDPNRDVGRLSDFTQKFNSKFIGLSAKEEVLNKMTKMLGVYHEVSQTKQRATKNHSNHKAMKTNNNYLINHTASYLLLNPKLELIGLLTNPHYAKKMAKALDLIIETLD